LFVTADLAQLIAVADDLPGPVLAAVERNTLEQSYGGRLRQRGHRHDIRRIGWIDGDGVFGLVSGPDANVDVLGNLRGGGPAGHDDGEQQGHSE
jgi:hypothetical protein